MKIIHIISTLILGLLITACNSTPKEVKLVKKPLISDHYLLMSLVNRPVTTDQQMILAFQKQRESQYGGVFVNTISIKGPKLADNSKPLGLYNSLINEDVNAISIQGPSLNENKS
jgi:hypothetical protein